MAKNFKFMGLLATFMVAMGLYAASAALSAPAANAALHPCRNWDHSQLTTAKFRQALKQYPQCGKAWAALTRAPGGKVNPMQYVVRGKRSDIKPGQNIINSGISDTGHTNLYKYRVKPGDVFVNIENTATAVAAVAKSDCLNPSAKAPAGVVNNLPRMVTLSAWAKAEATARAAVYVRVRTQCPGSITTVTVRVWVYAHSRAEARSKARSEQVRASHGHPSAMVWAMANATARAKIGISIITTCTVKPVPVTPQPKTQNFQFRVFKWWQIASGEFVTGHTVSVDLVRNGVTLENMTVWSGTADQPVWTPKPSLWIVQLGDQLCERIPAGMVLGDPQRFPQCQTLVRDNQDFVFWNKEVPKVPPPPGCQTNCNPPPCQSNCNTQTCPPGQTGTPPNCIQPKGNNNPPPPPGNPGGGTTPPGGNPGPPAPPPPPGCDPKKDPNHCTGVDSSP